MATPVNAVTAAAPEKTEQPTDPKFEKALANAQEADPPFEIPVDQLAQMGAAVLAPLFMSRMQDIIGEAMGGED